MWNRRPHSSHSCLRLDPDNEQQTNIHEKQQIAIANVRMCRSLIPQPRWGWKFNGGAEGGGGVGGGAPKKKTRIFEAFWPPQKREKEKFLCCLVGPKKSKIRFFTAPPPNPGAAGLLSRFHFKKRTKENINKKGGPGLKEEKEESQRKGECSEFQKS